jgi:hypothetical protein
VVEIENERHFSLPFDEVWQRLVSNLSKSFFVINNIEKESNLLNLSFSANDPETYVDCGRTTRIYEGQTYSYEVAADSFYKTARQAGTNAFWVLSVNRDTDLEGRINVYVASEGDGTTVSVNAKYILSVTTSGTGEAIAGALRISQGHQPIPSETSTVAFTTGTAGTEGELVCRCTGVLESMILDMVE